jgi:hypothetical protein
LYGGAGGAAGSSVSFAVGSPGAQGIIVITYRP